LNLDLFIYRNLLVGRQGRGAGRGGEVCVMITEFAASAEAHVNTTTQSEQDVPQVVVLESGNYVVAWKDWSGAPGNSRFIRGQLYAPDGTPIGGEFRLDSTDVQPWSSFALAALPGGGFIAAWGGDAGIQSDDAQLRAQIFNADTSKAGAEFTVNTTSIALQDDPAVDVLANGNIVVTWTNYSGEQRSGPDPSGTSVMGQIVSPAGTLIGSEFLVNSFTQSAQENPAVTALAGGGFVATWTDGSGRYGGDTDLAVVGQIFSDTGVKIGAAFLVNAQKSFSQQSPVVAALPSGGFVVAWSDSWTGEVKARLFDPAGTAAGGEIVVGPGGLPVISLLAGGGFLIAHLRQGAIESQLFDDSGAKVGGPVVLRDSAGAPGAPAIAGLADGGFVLAYGAALDPATGQINAERGIGAIRFGVARDGVSSLGTADADSIAGTDFADYIDGQGGDDAIGGGAGDDILYGRSGNDVLGGGEGADRLIGGLGDDLYLGVDADDVIVEEGGIDEVRTGLASYALAGGVENLTGLSGTGQALTGNGLANRILGGAGDDRLEGAGGDDSLDGGGGADQLIGGLGNDFYAVGEGDTVVEAPGAGTDSVATALAAYALGENVENLTGLSGAGQALTGNALGNRIVGGAGADTLAGGDGADILDGGMGSDQLSGGAGNDLLYYVADPAGADVDAIDGAAGLDTLFVSFPNPAEAAGVTWSLTANPLGGYDGWIANGAGDRVEFTQIERFRLSGTAVADSLSGGALDDLLLGLGGDDVLDGGDGADGLDGGEGADRMTGGSGNDSYYVDSDGDQVVEAENGGTDSVTTSLAVYGLGENVERLFGDLASGQRLTGNALANVVAGGAGNDTLDGGAGADQLLGYEGDDVYFLDNVADSIGELSGTDEVRTTLATLDLSGAWFIENITGLLDSGQVLIGNEQGNVIRGGGGSDSLEGRTGNDQLFGGGGNDILDGGLDSDSMQGGLGDDIYLVNVSTDTVVELSGEGIDEIRTALSFYNLQSLPFVENLTGLSSQRQWLIGNGAANVLKGGAGNDTLEGGGGNDSLDGGAGADEMKGGSGSDIYFVDNGSDSVVELSGQGVDEVRTSLATFSLAALTFVENLTGTSATGQTLIGNVAPNVLTGGTGNDILDGGAGADSMRGGLGNDVYLADNAGDLVEENAGGGTDEVRTALAGYSLAANVEKLTAISDSPHDFRGNATDNVLTGGAGNDLLRLNDGGNDTASGGSGSDVLYFGGAFTGADIADGGEGRDVLVLQGNYTLTLSATNLAGIESISLQSGSRTTWGDVANNFYDYAVTTNDANVAAGQQLIVNGQTLRAGEDFSLDGSAETDGYFLVYGGHGVDTLKGGAGNDAFFFEGVRWGAGDSVDGGAGRDAVIISSGSGINHFDFGANALTGIESISLNNRYTTDPTQKPSYELVLSNGNVAPGATLIVNGSSLADPGQTVSVDGSAVHDGNLILFGGFGKDTLTGGDGADLIQGGEGVDVLTGGAGADTFRYAGQYDATSQLPDRILDFASGVDKIDLTRIDADLFTDGDQAFHWVGSSAFTGAGAASAGELRAWQYEGSWYVEGDMDGNGSADLVIQLTTPVAPPVQGDFLL
jgi:Ca2+-binding RTX toxin-like protein